MQWFRKSNKLQNLAPTYLKGHSQKQNFCQRYQIFFWFLINLKCQFHKQNLKWGVVVVQLAEELLLIPEICRSNPVIGNFVHYQKLRKKFCHAPIPISFWNMGQTRPIFIILFFTHCKLRAAEWQVQMDPFRHDGPTPDQFLDYFSSFETG